MTIPFEYDEAAIMDGASYWTTLLENHAAAVQAGPGDSRRANIVAVWTDFFGPRSTSTTE